MSFDSKFKELARAHDAVDRLKDVKRDMERRAPRDESRYDRIVRSLLIALIAVVVGIAIWKL